MESLNSLTGKPSFTVPEIVLPIGISFYIFQSMSYVIDVYRGQVEPQHNPLTFGTYVALFPQLIAGPIVRYRDIADQLREREETRARFAQGVVRFIYGLAKKVLLANQMGLLADRMLLTEAGTLSAWVGMAAYTLQIYFDFSGYSDMAIGLGRMFGFRFKENFDYPYVSSSITEFWRRWHISLSSWFREYVYIPLGGNRKGLARQCLNLLIVWMLTGLWHGASVNFVLWGLYYAVLLILEKLFFGKLTARLPRLLQQLLTLLVVAFGWGIFYYTDLGLWRDALVGSLFSPGGIPPRPPLGCGGSADLPFRRLRVGRRDAKGCSRSCGAAVGLAGDPVAGAALAAVHVGPGQPELQPLYLFQILTDRGCDMKKTINLILNALFCLVLFVVPALFFALPKTDFSASEKRYLERVPTFSFQSLTDGSYTEGLSSYVADHFPLRDLFVGLNAYYDLFSGRQYTKDYGLKDGRLYAAPTAFDTAALDKNTERLNNFASELASVGWNIPVRLMLVPSAGAVALEEGETPWQYADRAIIDYVYSRTSLQTIDVMDDFLAQTDRKALYYATDHHWTALGAWEAARLYAGQLGCEMPTRESYRITSGGDFRGSAWSGSGLWLTKPDTLELWESGTTVSVTNENGEERDSVFYRERLDELDKYTVFLDGNHSLVKITHTDSEQSSGVNVLVIRDSFSNSLGCFLADVCDKVVLVDLRYYKLPLGELIQNENINEILVEYSCDNFVKDTNLAFLSAALPER